MFLISNFRLYDLQSDVIAGLTVALTVIPQSLAYANIANLPPQVISSNIVVLGYNVGNTLLKLFKGTPDKFP